VTGASSGQLSGVTVVYQVAEEKTPKNLVQNRDHRILVRCPSAVLQTGAQIKGYLSKIQINRLLRNAKNLLEVLKTFLKVSLFSAQKHSGFSSGRSERCTWNTNSGTC